MPGVRQFESVRDTMWRSKARLRKRWERRFAPVGSKRDRSRVPRAKRADLGQVLLRCTCTPYPDSSPPADVAVSRRSAGQALFKLLHCLFSVSVSPVGDSLGDRCPRNRYCCIERRADFSQPGS